MMLPDELLYRRLREGDHRAFDALYDRYEKKLFGFALRYLGNRQEAEEIFHETFVTVLRSKEVSFAGGSFQAWLFQIARNLCLDRLRAAKRRHAVGEELGFEPTLAAPSAAVTRAADELPPLLGEVYRLRATGMSYDEMAVSLDIPVGTVKSRVHQMILTLRE